MPSNVHIPRMEIHLADGFTLTWDGDENRPNYFTGMTHTRYVDKANTATINLTYVPRSGEEANMLEQSIAGSKGDCKFRYGYTGNMGQWYRGLIYNYTVGFADGYLEYTLSLCSKAVECNLSEVFDCTFYKGGIVDGKLVTNYALECVRQIMRSPDLSQLYELDESSADALLDSTLPCGISFSGVSAMNALKQFVSVLVPTDILDPGGWFSVVVDDAAQAGEKGRIKIVKSPSRETPPSRTVTFEWNNRDSDVVSWSVGYNGNVAIFRSRGEDSKASLDPENGRYAFKLSTGDAASHEGSFNAADPMAIPNQAAYENSWWNTNANYPYTATLEVLGRPPTDTSDVEIAHTVFQVNPYIMGALHHTAGRYLVLGIEDKISDSGFTTKYNLVRYDSESYDISKESHTTIIVGDKSYPLDEYDPYSVR